MTTLARRHILIGGALAWTVGGAAFARETGSGILDGRDFDGILGPADGEGRQIPDSLHFREGFYWSRGCIACSFAPGPYWTREIPGGIEFTGTLQSPERGAFQYFGSVTEAGCAVEIGWRRERWYWTLERDFRFDGAETETPGATLEAAFTRAGAPRDPACTL